MYLLGCKGTVNYLDDIVVTGKNETEHLNNLYEVLNKLDKAAFKPMSGGIVLYY